MISTNTCIYKQYMLEFWNVIITNVLIAYILGITLYSKLMQQNQIHWYTILIHHHYNMFQIVFEKMTTYKSWNLRWNKYTNQRLVSLHTANRNYTIPLKQKKIAYMLSLAIIDVKIWQNHILLYYCGLRMYIFVWWTNNDWKK